MKRTIFGQTKSVTAQQELINATEAGFDSEVKLSVEQFYISNEGQDVIAVSINDGSFIELYVKEMLNLSGITEVYSCKVDRVGTVRFGGVI